MFLRLIIFLLAALPVLGVSVRDPRWPQIEFEFSAALEPADSGSANLPGGVLVRAGRVYRIFSDTVHGIYFGYDVVLEGPPDGTQFQIRVEPFSAPPQLMGLNPAWTKLSLPGNPLMTELRLGATMKLDLLVNPATGQKIVDSITIRQRGTNRKPPRDFTVADAMLRFDRPELGVDGTVVGNSGGISGIVVWFYAPDRGRFVVSLVPHPGFQKIGEVTDTRLTIRDESTVYEIDSRNSIAPGEGTFFIYVRHDRGWRPQGDAASRFQMGAADNPNWIR